MKAEDAVALSERRLAAGDAAGAWQATAAMAAVAVPDHGVLAQHARALQLLGRDEEALAVLRRAAARFPTSAVAHHNLAAALGDRDRFAEAERCVAAAFGAGGDAAESWLVLGRALLGQNRLDEAEQAFAGAVRRRPDMLAAQRDLAQLIWMRSADVRAALATLDATLRRSPTPALIELRATVLEYAGDAAAAYETVRRAIGRDPRAAVLNRYAAHLAARLGEGAAALAHAEAALAGAPGDYGARDAMVVACLAVGEAALADEIAAGMVAERPLDQRAVALQATAWRLLGDGRYATLYDYARLVRAWTIDVPEGWPDLPSYLADLAMALDRLHPFTTHPLDQSLRHGSQAAHLLNADNPAIRAFFGAVQNPIARHLAALGTGDDPVRSRNTGRFRFAGAWSVQLRPGGYHTDHVHPEGWLSSACYIAFPHDRPKSGQEGWIRFGAPAVTTRPTLSAEHVIKPEPGMLVLFPSYMWHGTVPFGGDHPRLTVAFDVVPGGAESPRTRTRVMGSGVP